MDHDFSGLKATFVNCTLKRSPEVSNTQGLIDASAAIMRKHHVEVEEIRFVDHDIATGVWPDMREHGWETDEWPAMYPGILASDILVVAGPIWLGDNSSQTKMLIERLYSLSGELNDKGQYLFYGRVAGCIITGNEDGIKHCAQNVLYSLQHIGYTIPPNADAGWIGEAGPGPSYLDPGSGGPENDFTNRNTTFMTWNLMHLAKMLKDAGGVPGLRQPEVPVERRHPIRLGEPRVPVMTVLTAPDVTTSKGPPAGRTRYFPAMSAATGDDRDLVDALRAGDEQAFAALIDGWSGSMLRMARLHVPTDSVAEEVVQETWLAVLTGLHRFRGDSSLRTWVYRILLNQAKTRGIRERRTVPFASLYDEDGNGDGPTVDPSRFQGAGDAHPGGWRRFPEEWPEQSLLSNEMREVVTRALEELPPRQRVVVALRDLDGHTADEVCELLTITAGNQRVLLHRGRAVVRAHLERYYEAASLSGQGVTS